MPSRGYRFIFKPTLTGFFTMLGKLAEYDGDIVSIDQAGGGLQSDLFGDAVMIEEDAGGAERALARLRLSGGRSVEQLSSAFLSGLSIGLAALRYTSIAFGGSLEKLDDETDPDIRAVKTASRRVMKEVDKFMGILRFAPRRDGAYVAEFEPDADILELLVPRFLERFGDTPFMLSDRKRCKAAGTAPLAGRSAEAGGEAAIVENALNRTVERLNRPKDDVEELWKVFYRATENPARPNPSLRRKFLPLRYWKYLPELIDEDP
jgi:probable DNA metabolism protein